MQLKLILMAPLQLWTRQRALMRFHHPMRQLHTMARGWVRRHKLHKRNRWRHMNKQGK